jgi:hypothetical protein
MRWFLLAVVAALLITTPGCGRARSKVHGTITYHGTPLAGGTIILVGPDNQTYPARIAKDGSYKIASVPRGQILVSVQADTPRVPPRPQPGARDSDAFAKGEMSLDDQSKGGRPPAQPAGPTVTLPVRYNDPNQSGLTFELSLADQEYSVDLK